MASVMGLEPHHLIMSTIWEHGYRSKIKKNSYENSHISISDHHILEIQ